MVGREFKLVQMRAGLVEMCTPAVPCHFPYTADILEQMLPPLSRINATHIRSYNEALAEDALTCATLDDMGFLIHRQLFNAEVLVKLNRKHVLEYCREHGALSVLQNNTSRTIPPSCGVERWLEGCERSGYTSPGALEVERSLLASVHGG